MKTLINILLIIIVSSLSALAQKQQKADTLFYLVDTTKAPVNDRTVQIGVDGSFKYYAIKCECLKFDQMPTFFYNLKKDKLYSLITEDSFKQINFATLDQLINLFQTNKGGSFNSRHVIYFIEYENGAHVKHRVKLFIPPKKIPTIDYENIKKDSL